MKTDEGLNKKKDIEKFFKEHDKLIILLTNKVLFSSKNKTSFYWIMKNNCDGKEDIYQMVRENVFLNYDKYDKDRASISTWLGNIVITTLLQYKRSSLTQKRSVQQNKDSDEIQE